MRTRTTTTRARAMRLDTHDDDARRADAWAMTAIGAALLAFVLGSTRAGAQGGDDSRGADARFRPFLGCWTPVEAAGAATPAAAPVTCIVPDGRGAVRVLALVDGRVAEDDRIAVGGREPVRDEECTGWEQGTWSADGRRLYLDGELSCGGGATRRASGMLTLLDDQLLDVRAVRTADGGGLGVRRLRALDGDLTLPDGRTIAATPSRAVRDARLAAGGEVTVREIIDVSRAVDERVLEAWLLERRRGVALSGDALLALAEAKVPARTIDLLVALDNPTRYTVSIGAPGRGAIMASQAARVGGANAAGFGMGSFPRRGLFPGWGIHDWSTWGPTLGWSNWGLVSPWAAPWYGFNSFFGGPFGGWLGPMGPVVIVPATPGTGGIPGQPGSGSEGVRPPRMIEGVGARRDGSGVSPSMGPRGASGGGFGGSAGGGYGGSAGGGSGGGRTAKPRP